MTHWIAGVGMHGCTYESFDVFKTKTAALDWVQENVEGFSTFGRRELSTHLILELYTGRRDQYGTLRMAWKTGDSFPTADTSTWYCEIQQCSCDHPQQHSELIGKDWKEYWND